MESLQEIRQYDDQLASDIEQLMRTAYNGVSLYKSIAIILGSDKQASLWLNEHGVQGVRYNSGSMENDYNFVIFDDNAIKMLEKETYDSAGNIERETYNQDQSQPVINARTTWEKGTSSLNSASLVEFFATAVANRPGHNESSSKRVGTHCHFSRAI